MVTSSWAFGAPPRSQEEMLIREVPPANCIFGSGFLTEMPRGLIVMQVMGIPALTVLAFSICLLSLC